MSEHTSGSSADADRDADLFSSDAAARRSANMESPSLVPDSEPASGKRDPLGPAAGKLMIMAPPRAQDRDDFRVDPAATAGHESKPSTSARKTSAVMMVAVVAGIAGALGAAMATAGVSYFSSKPDLAVAAGHARALDASMTRIESDLSELRNNVNRVAKAGASQAGKTAERLDRIEKAQAEPAAKLAKLTETVEKLRVAAAAPTPAPAPVAAAPAVAPAAIAAAAPPPREITGSIAASTTAAPAPAPKPELARLPTLEGWVLLDVGKGSAMIEGRAGVFEVVAGDPVPGLGRIDAIRRQDGRWAVVTSKGLIVAR